MEFPFTNHLLCIVFALAICSGCSSGWSDTISKQNHEPGFNAEIDSIVEKFMVKYDMPGLSLAIAKNDSLLYLKGYGYADISTQKEVTDSSLFRIGCLSQPITAMAILKLAEQGKISLDEKVFGNDGILDSDYGSKPYDARVNQITVKELLDHCAGWENDNNTTFVSSSLSASQLLSLVLDSVPLQSAPGKNFNFSFLGYIVLGKIIEKVTGKTYAEYVHEEILDPSGDTDMKIAGNTINDHQKNEVTHYMWRFLNHDDTEEPYAQNISEMQAACGWLASAKDLLRLLIRVDKFKYKPDMFNDSMMKIMLTPYDSNSHFSGGWWSNNKFQNWFAMSSYWGAGTVSEMARADNGYCWVMLTNKTPQHGGSDDDLDKMIWEIINDSSIRWPKKDLFLYNGNQ